LSLPPQIAEVLHHRIFYFLCAIYTGIVVIHAVLSTRDGYCVSLSHQAAAALGGWGPAWRPLVWLLKRGATCSARPPAAEYLAPYPLKVGLVRVVYLCGCEHVF